MDLDEEMATYLVGMGARSMRSEIIARSEQPPPFNAGPAPRMYRADDIYIKRRGGSYLSARVLVPDEATNGVCVFYHGSGTGWISGSISTYERLAKKLAERLNYTFVLPRYRQAPEFVYPAATDDAYLAYVWAYEHHDKLSASYQHIVVLGSGAGGNLAAAVPLRARRDGHPQPIAQILLCPVLDHDLDRPSYKDRSRQLILSREAMAECWDAYVPLLTDREHEYVSPCRTSSVRGISPAVVVTAGLDPLVDEAREYAQRLDEEGLLLGDRHFGGYVHDFVNLHALFAGERVIQCVLSGVRDAERLSGLRS
jgi:acetyl esterase